MSFKCSLRDIDRSQSNLIDYLSFLSCLTTCYCLLSSSLLMRLSLLNTIISIPNPSLPAQDVSILSLTAVQVRCGVLCGQINTWLTNKDVDQDYLIVFTLSLSSHANSGHKELSSQSIITPFTFQREITLYCSG